MQFPAKTSRVPSGVIPVNRPFAAMTSFYYYDKNPSGFCFLVQIRAFVI